MGVFAFQHLTTKFLSRLAANSVQFSKVVVRTGNGAESVVYSGPKASMSH
jgi:hypothetical protein